MKRLEKKLSAFLLGEEGKITKQSVISVGALVGTSALLGGMAEAHTSSITSNYEPTNYMVTGSHGSHSAHSAHSVHASHGSHGSHGVHSAHSAHSAHASHASHSSSWP